MRLVRKIGDPGFRWPEKLEVGAEVLSSGFGRRLVVTFINTKDGTVWLED